MAPHAFVEELTLASIRKAKAVYEKTELRERLRLYHGDNVDSAFWGWNQVWLNPDYKNLNLEALLRQMELPAILGFLRNHFLTPCPASRCIEAGNPILRSS